mgnify:CR=1 FL=1
MPLTLEQLNAASAQDALQLLDGLYEHSPWIAKTALAQRPFASVPQLKCVLAQVVSSAPRDGEHTGSFPGRALRGRGARPAARPGPTARGTRRNRSRSPNGAGHRGRRPWSRRR